MLAFTMFLKNNKWPLLLILLLVFSHGLIYRLGHTVSSLEGKDAIIANQQQIAKQVEQLSTLSTNVSLVAKLNTKESASKMTTIIDSVKDKPMTTLIDGKCEPTDEFMNAYIAIIREGNSK